MKKYFIGGFLCAALQFSAWSDDSFSDFTGQLDLGSGAFLYYLNDMEMDKNTFMPLLKTRLFYGEEQKEFFAVDDFVVEDVFKLSFSEQTYLLVLLRDQSRAFNLLPQVFMFNGAKEPLLLDFSAEVKEDFLPLSDGLAEWRETVQGISLFLQKAINYHVSTPPHVFEQRSFLISGQTLKETGRTFSEADSWSQQINLGWYYMQVQDYANAVSWYEQGLKGLHEEDTESARILIREVESNLELCRKKR